MLLAIIPIQSVPAALVLMQQAQTADIFEFRLDYMSDMDVEAVRQLQQAAGKPVIFTLRKKAQGGVYAGSEALRLATLLQLAWLNPDYVDIEHDAPIAFCEELKGMSPTTQLIRSYHHFYHTPDNLPELLADMMHPLFSYYKIITTAESILDSLKVLQFVKTSAMNNLVAHAMGEYGVVSRVLGKIMGNCFTYAAVSQDEIAPGLLTCQELTEIYHYHGLNKNTQIYGLIGDPVAQSIGHLFHNAEFIKHNQNAVYVKFHVKPEELADFFAESDFLSIQGFSVTMPHKQAVLKYCAEITSMTRDIGAANTLIKHDMGYMAANTDGDAVMSLLPDDLKHKKIIMLGAGGTASSIIFRLVNKGAIVAVYNRSLDKLDTLRTQYPVKTFPLAQLKNADYDILINTIPAQYYAHDVPFITGKIVMDVNYQAAQTPLMAEASHKGCIIIDGYAMFYAQAKMQRILWFNHE